jgi:predicted dehydrogenase
VTAHGTPHVSGREDVGLATLRFGKRLLASVHVNWLSPVKIRQMVIGGARKSLVLNDLDPTEKVRVYDRSVIPQAGEDPSSILIDYRLGDMWAPHLGTEEPLQALVRHFAECCLEGRTPITDGHAGLRIVEVLESIDDSMARHGAPVSLPVYESSQVRRAA